MKLAESGSRGVFWRANPRGTQELRGEGKRERGDWWVRWACPYGHLHRALIGPKSLAKEESERKRLEKPCPDRKPKPTSYLLGDVIDGYLEATKLTKRSHHEDSRHGKRWKERFSGCCLEEVTPADLDRIRTELLSGGEEGKDGAIAPATVNRQLAFLRRVFNIAIRDGKTERNPVAKLKALREPSGRTRYLSDDEEDRLLRGLPTDEDRDRVRVLLNTGLRKSEFLGLRWGDVDSKAGVLTIPRSKNGEARHVRSTRWFATSWGAYLGPWIGPLLSSRIAKGSGTCDGLRKPSLRLSAPPGSTISVSTIFDIPSPHGWPWRA